MTKVRQTERLLERIELRREAVRALGAPARPQGRARARASIVARLAGAVVARGDFTLGPVDLDLVPGERLAVTGRNGSGKSTLLARSRSASCRSSAGARDIGRSTVIGTLDQERDRARRRRRCSRRSSAVTGLEPVDARTLLAKFGLGADHVGRPWSTLSPGERTRAHLAELQARERQPAAPRRADEPPRPRGDRAARDRAAGLRRHARRRLPRPALPRGHRADAGAPAGLSPAPLPQPLCCAIRYTPQPLMAVPKRKTSKARRDKRRAQHGIEAPRVNVCPNCGSPKRPTTSARRARRIVAATSSRSARPLRSPWPSGSPSTPSGATVPRRRSSQAPLDAASPEIDPGLFGPGRSRHARARARRHDRRLIAMDDKPAEAVRGKPDSSLVARGARPSATETPTPSSRPGTRARCSRRACSTCGGSRACSGPRSRS